MFRNYLKVAIRALWRYKMFSVINVLVFTLGMTLCLLILLMMRDQSSYDTFHANKERINRVISDVTEEDRARSFATSPAPLAGVLLENDTAVRFFPNVDPVRKAVHINGEDFLIPGVLEKPAGKTNLRFDGLASCIDYVRIDGQDFQVIGVTEEFHFSRIRHEITPLAWGLDNLLLSPYAYRVEMTLGDIVILIIPVAGLLGLTIATQAFRGARINPAMMLRQE